jgi:hypothetical protein
LHVSFDIAISFQEWLCRILVRAFVRRFSGVRLISTEQAFLLVEKTEALPVLLIKSPPFALGPHDSARYASAAGLVVVGKDLARARKSQKWGLRAFG